MKLRIHRLAVEINHEVDYYEDRQPGLGAELERQAPHHQRPEGDAP